jgi:hypothetical protein
VKQGSIPASPYRYLAGCATHDHIPRRGFRRSYRIAQRLRERDRFRNPVPSRGMSGLDVRVRNSHSCVRLAQFGRRERPTAAKPPKPFGPWPNILPCLGAERPVAFLNGTSTPDIPEHPPARP